MTNLQVYKKTLPFSFVMFLVGLLEIALFAGCCTAGFFILNRSTDMALVGLAIGFLVGIIVICLMNIFVNNRIKAAQIAMMTKGVTEDKLPDHTFKEGFVEIRGRFGKITAFFFITNAIKGIFRQIGRGCLFFYLKTAHKICDYKSDTHARYRDKNIREFIRMEYRKNHYRR